MVATGPGQENGLLTYIRVLCGVVKQTFRVAQEKVRVRLANGAN